MWVEVKIYEPSQKTTKIKEVKGLVGDRSTDRWLS